MTFRDAAFHRECFLCTKCNAELAHVKFATKDDNPYCPECYVKLFAKICEKCNQPIAGKDIIMLVFFLFFCFHFIQQVKKFRKLKNIKSEVVMRPTCAIAILFRA